MHIASSCDRCIYSPVNLEPVATIILFLVMLYHSAKLFIFINSFVRSFIRSSVSSFVRSFIHSLINSSIRMSEKERTDAA